MFIYSNSQKVGKMFSKLTNLFNKSAVKPAPKSTFSYDQAVILNIQLVDEAKESDNYQSIIEIENTIKKVLPLKYGIDGHEFGEGECTMYIYGPDANKLWVLVEPVLKLSEFSRIEVTLQYGMPNDPKTKDKSFTL